MFNRQYYELRTIFELFSVPYQNILAMKDRIMTMDCTYGAYDGQSISKYGEVLCSIFCTYRIVHKPLAIAYINVLFLSHRPKAFIKHNIIIMTPNKACWDTLILGLLV